MPRAAPTRIVDIQLEKSEIEEKFVNSIIQDDETPVSKEPKNVPA